MIPNNLGVGNLPKWDIFEISSETEALTGVKFRGRIRKFGLENGIHVLAVNAKDEPGRVRFAVISDGGDAKKVKNFIYGIFPSAKIYPKLMDVKNPVLDKIQCNFEKRYDI